MENARLINETREALEQQTATAEILRVISQSPTDVQPVFEAVAKAAVQFCGAEDAVITLREGSEAVIVAHEGPKGSEFAHYRNPLDRTFVRGRAILDGRTIHVPDLLATADYPKGQEEARTLGHRAVLVAPMLRDQEAIGCITLRKPEPVAFTPRQIELLEIFAAQAVIAIENVRLFTELREALEQQTATAEVLRVINASPGDLEPVFDAMLEKAIDLCGAKFGTLYLHDGKVFKAVALRNVPAAYEEAVRGQSFSPERNNVLRHLQEHKQPHHLKDVFDEAYLARDPLRVAAVELGGVRSLVAVPLLKGSELIGFIGIYRDQPGGFADSEIALVSAFADQAVIAIENVRLITETNEALEQQTATAQVLQTINGSPGDLEPVFDAILGKAMVLCEAAFGIFNIFDGRRFQTVAARGVPESYVQYRLSEPPDYGPDTGPGRLLAGEDFVHVVDMADSSAYRAGDPNRRAIVDLGGARSNLAVALRKENELLGMMAIYRQEVRPFYREADRTSAEFRCPSGDRDGKRAAAWRTARSHRDLQESLKYQTATSDVLKVISRSTFDSAEGSRHSRGVRPSFCARPISARSAGAKVMRTFWPRPSASALKRARAPKVTRLCQAAVPSSGRRCLRGVPSISRTSLQTRIMPGRISSD